MQTLEDLEIDLLLQGIYQHFGDDFRGFERGPLREKLRHLQQDWGMATMSALQERILHHDDAAHRLRRELSFNAGTLFDNPERVAALRNALGPWLRSCALPRIWVADCSTGEDVFALTILLADEGLYERTQIFATSPSDVLLHEASQGLFPAERLERYAENYRRSGGRHSLSDYCQKKDGIVSFASALRSNITWAQYSLASDTSFNEFQFILCRRPLDDFGPFLRRRALWLFSESLSPFGLLALPPGNVDGAALSLSYKTLSRGNGLYQRKA